MVWETGKAFGSVADDPSADRTTMSARMSSAVAVRPKGAAAAYQGST
jgi:hypothetical protein